MGKYAATSTMAVTTNSTSAAMIEYESRINSGPPLARVPPLPTKRPVPIHRELGAKACDLVKSYQLCHLGQSSEHVEL